MRYSALLLGLAWAPSVAAVPAEVPPTMTFGADKATLSWSAAAGATSHHVYRGEHPSLHDHACRKYRAPGNAVALPEVPGEAGLYYFLVSGVNEEGEGILGNDSDGDALPNPYPCTDVDGDLVADNLDNCPSVTNPGQEDQNGDALGDRCDPKTYDFEQDIPGTPPSAMTRVGPLAQSFTVKDLEGDLSVSFDEAGVGAHERFDRVEAAAVFRDTDVWIDFEEAPLFGSVELWSDGAFGWNAGAGIIVQFSDVNDVRVYDRTGNQVPVQDFRPPVPAGGRVRLRLRKGPGSESSLHMDSWNGLSFDADWAVWTLADDHRYRGLSTVVADYLGGSRRFKRVTVETHFPEAPFAVRKDFRWSDDWKVFQRDADDVALVMVRFDHRSEFPGRVEARVVLSSDGTVLTGHDWTDHAVSVGSAPEGASGELPLAGVPVGGNYDVEVRLVRESDGSLLAEDRIRDIAVGDVFLAGGQSNMSGYSGDLTGAETPIDEVHLFGNDYRWKRASEPMDGGTDQVDLVSAESPLHTLLLRFGKEIHQATTIPVGIIPGPLGGTNLYNQWQRNEADPDDRGTLYGSLLHRGLVQGYAAPFRGFLWYQGESDVGRSDYEANLKQLISRYREDLDAPDLWFGVVQLATNLYSNLENWVGLQEQQRRAVETTLRTVLSTTVDLPRSDTIHLNVEGYKTAGVRLAAEFREHAYGEPLDASARLVKATVIGNGRSIELEYDRDVAGGLAGLFRVRDAGAGVDVRNISTSGRFATLSLSARVQTGATVSYGYNWDPAVDWLKDSGGTPVPCFKDYPTTP